MKTYGLLLEPIVAEKDYVLGSYGSLGGDVLQPSGQWDAFLPYNESQLDAAGFDAIACATFGTFNAIEMLNRRQYDTERNWSDRFLAKTSGTTPQGNSPHTVAETLRKTGAPNEVDYPYLPTIQTWDQFYADIPQGIFGLATAFSTEFDFKHEYVPTTPAYLKQALQYSPLGISVFAWLKDTTTGLYHKPAGYTDNHWCVLVGYVDGEYWLVYDSYEPQELKKLQWDFAFQIAKRYSLTRHVADEKTWYQHLIELILANFKPAQVPIAPPPPPTPPAPKYLWDTPEHAKHSVRVICDEFGFTLEQKNTMCATIMCESGFHIDAVNHNMSNGRIASTDYGICQWNDFYHATEITPNEALNNPQKAVRLMCQYWKRGQRDLWIAYKSGAYKKYL